MHFKGIKAVLFDLDGTVLDSYPDLGAAANAVLISEGGRALPLERYRCMAGAGARGLLNVALGVTPDDVDFERLRTLFFQEYESNICQLTSIFSGVEELISWLNLKGILWGIVTNKSIRFTGPLIKNFTIFASASTVISGDTTPHSKPHPEPILEALRRMNIKPSECVYVGDDARDIAAGAAAGTATVAVSYGYLGIGADINSWGADVVIDHPMALVDLLCLS
jgi:N-acetyl-D-muramate 6-phosphate phosphatase